MPSCPTDFWAHRAALLAFVAATLLPAGMVFVDSFVAEGRLSHRAYARVLGDSRQLRLAKNSLYVSAVSLVAANALAVPLTLLLTRTNVPGAGAFLTMSLVPLIIPPYIASCAWVHLLGQNGWINVGLRRMFGLEAGPLSIYGVVGSGLVLGSCYFPFIVLLLARALRMSSGDLAKAAACTAASPLRQLHRIWLRLAGPDWLAGNVLVFVFTLCNFGVPTLLRVNVYPVEIFSQFSAFYDTARAAAQALPLTLAAIVLLLVGRTLFLRGSHTSVLGASGLAPRISLGSWRWVAAGFCSIVLLAIVAAPLVVLAVKVKGLGPFLQTARLAREAILASLAVACVSATIASVLALAVGITMLEASPAARTFGAALVLVPLAIPGSITGIGLIRLWNHPGLPGMVYQSWAILVCACVARFAPLAVFSVGNALGQISPEYVKTARAFGVRGPRRAARVLFPLILRGFFAGWILVYLFSLGELAASVLIAPPGSPTLPIRMFSLLHFGEDQKVAALCLATVALALGPVCVFKLVNRPNYESHRHGQD